MKKENTATSFSGNDVGEALGGVFDQALDKPLPFLFHNQLIKGIGVKLDVGKVLDVELAPALDSEGKAGNGRDAGEYFLLRDFC